MTDEDKASINNTFQDFIQNPQSPGIIFSTDALNKIPGIFPTMFGPDSNSNNPNEPSLTDSTTEISDMFGKMLEEDPTGTTSKITQAFKAILNPDTNSNQEDQDEDDKTAVKNLLKSASDLLEETSDGEDPMKKMLQSMSKDAVDAIENQDESSNQESSNQESSDQDEDSSSRDHIATMKNLLESANGILDGIPDNRDPVKIILQSIHKDMLDAIENPDTVKDFNFDEYLGGIIKNTTGTTHEDAIVGKIKAASGLSPDILNSLNTSNASASADGPNQESSNQDSNPSVSADGPNQESSTQINDSSAESSDTAASQAQLDPTKIISAMFQNIGNIGSSSGNSKSENDVTPFMAMFQNMGKNMASPSASNVSETDNLESSNQPENLDNQGSDDEEVDDMMTSMRSLVLRSAQCIGQIGVEMSQKSQDLPTQTNKDVDPSCNIPQTSSDNEPHNFFEKVAASVEPLLQNIIGNIMVIMELG